MNVYSLCNEKEMLDEVSKYWDNNNNSDNHGAAVLDDQHNTSERAKANNIHKIKSTVVIDVTTNSLKNTTKEALVDEEPTNVLTPIYVAVSPATPFDRYQCYRS